MRYDQEVLEDEEAEEDESIKEKKGKSRMKRASVALAKTMDYAATALRRKGTEPSFLPVQEVEVTSLLDGLDG